MKTTLLLDNPCLMDIIEKSAKQIFFLDEMPDPDHFGKSAL